MITFYDDYVEGLLGGHFSSFRKNLGNKLFIYGISRVAADILDYDLIVPENPLIRRELTSVGGYVNEIFPFKSITGRNRVETPTKSMDDIDLYNFNGLENFLNNYKNHHIEVLGYFTKYDYVKPYKEQIRSYYSSLVKPKKNNNDMVIMLRNSRDDARFVLPDEYYLNIIENESFDKLYVGYDHLYKHQSLIKKLEKYNPIYLESGILDIFSEITSFNKIIACQGTFSFWTSFLSNADKIYWPTTNDGPNSNNEVFNQFVNLKVDDEDRYTFIPIENIYK
jgi:hypothetical protein